MPDGSVRASKLDDLVTWLGDLRVQDFQYELRKLRAIRDWAFRQAGIDYEEGDKVRIADGYAVRRLNSDGSFNGWWHYRECLAGGSPGTAVKIDFSPHHEYWCTLFRPDREWSVSEDGTVRHWHGPAGDTPEGFEPPSEFEREHYPAGRKHTFMMRAQGLRRA